MLGWRGKNEQSNEVWLTGLCFARHRKLEAAQQQACMLALMDRFFVLVGLWSVPILDIDIQRKIRTN